MRPSLLFWVTACGVLLVGLGVPSLRGSEDRFAEIAREMALRGDYFHPRLNGESHFHKPLLSYWAILAASWSTGQLDELSARLPSALAGLAALVATIRLGGQCWGASVGRAAGWFLLSSYGFLLWARTAAADLENLAATILAVAWFRAREGRPGFVLYAVFGVICAVGAQAKGLAAIVLPILVLLPHLARLGRWRDHVRPKALALAGLVAALFYAAPFLWAEVGRASAGSVLSALASGDPESGLYMVFQENVRRFFAPHDHQGPVYTYLVALPVLLLPWALVFVASLWDASRGFAHLDPDARWVFWAMVLIFAVFTLSGSRRSYYILPILPFCALWLARASSEELEFPLVPPALRYTALGLVGALAAEGLGLLVVLPASWVGGWPVPGRLVAATLLVVGAGVVFWNRRRGWARGTASLLSVGKPAAVPIVLACLVLGGYFALQAPVLDRFRTEKPFALALRAEAECAGVQRLGFVQHVPSLFPFYLEATEPIPVLREREGIESFMANGPGWVVASPHAVAKLDGAETLPLFRRPPDVVEGLYPWDDSRKRLGAWWVGVLSPEPCRS